MIHFNKRKKMKNKYTAILITGIIALNGCAPIASIENAASKINAAIPAPNDTDYFAKQAIRNGCTSGMTQKDCEEVRNMQLVDKFVSKIRKNANKALALPVNPTNKGYMKEWLNTYEEIQNYATSAYSRKQLRSIESTMDAVEDRFFPNM